MDVPARADLAGGTLDLWPLYCLHRPAITVNAALTTGFRVRLRSLQRLAGTIRFSAPGCPPTELRPQDGKRQHAAAVAFALQPEGGLDIEVLEQPPIGSGLGGSSTFAVAVAKGCLALRGGGMSATRLAALLRDLEVGLLEVPTGVQDFYPALYGGVLAIHLDPGGESVERLPVARDWMGERLLVVYTGIAHSSGAVNWEVYRARIDGDRLVAARLQEIAHAATACREALLAHDEAGVGRAIAAEWAARRRLAPSVSRPELERILAAGLAAGARGGKACGAGGGGSVLLWTPPARRAAVAAAAVAAAPAGAFALPPGIATRGARVTMDTAAKAGRGGKRVR